MKLHVSSRKLTVVGAILAALSWTTAAQAAVVVIPAGSTVCVDSPPAPNWVSANATIQKPGHVSLTFRLRNVSAGQLVATVVGTYTPPALFSIPGNGSPDIYRLCANNNVSNQTVTVDLSISGY